jgi:hypothetical protein
MPSIARGYGGYHDVVDSVENPLFEDQEQDWTPGLDQQAQEVCSSWGPDIVLIFMPPGIV